MRRLLPLLAGLALAACSPKTVDNISKNYNKSALDVGIFPVFPPREEFQVGDIYLYAIDLKQREFISVWVDTDKHMLKAAEDFLATRVVFQEADNDELDKATDLTNGRIKTRGARGQTIDNLPLAAFPSITGDAGLTSGLGISRLFQAIGLGAATRTKVTLNFNDVRTYWVPPTKVLPSTTARMQRLREKMIFNSAETKNAVQSLAIKATGRAPIRFNVCAPGIQIGLIAISRVYLTRQIDYTFRNAQIVSAGVRRASGGTPLEDAPNAPEVKLDINLGDADDTTDDKLEVVQNVLKTVNEGSGANGQALSFQSWNALGITFSENYSRPVAIGWEGLPVVFEADKDQFGLDVSAASQNFSARQVFCKNYQSIAGTLR